MKPFFSNHFWLLCITTLLAGCQNGCTTSKTIDSESKTVTVNGQDCNITVRLIEFRNSKAKSRNNIFDRKVSYFYGVTYDVALPFWQGESVAELGVESDDVELEPFLDRFAIKMAANNQHFAFGVDNKVAAIYHLYKGHAFRSSSGTYRALEGTLSGLSFQDYEEPETIMLSQINGHFGCNAIMKDEHDAYISFLRDLNPADSSWVPIFASWPDCQVIKDYLTDAEIKRRCTDKKWRTCADRRIMEIMQETSFRKNHEEAERLVHAIGDPSIRNNIDLLHAANYGNSSKTASNKYINKRWKNLCPEAKKTIQNRALTAFDKFVRDGDEDFDFKTSYLVQHLLRTNQQDNIQQLIDRCLEFQFWNDNYFDIADILFDNYTHFSKKQQRQIMEKTLENLPKSKDYLQETIFEDAAPYMDCKLVREIYETYHFHEKPHIDWPEHCPQRPVPDKQKQPNAANCNQRVNLAANF